MTQMTETAIVEGSQITRTFHIGSRSVEVLHGINLHIQPGEFVALRGRSGSGKTTLLHLLVGLDDPTSGEIRVVGRTLTRLSEEQRADLRREHIGLLFQNAHLFPTLTAQENVEVALRLQLTPATERTQRAREALELVEISARAKHRSMELSGGEQQRVALARALVHRPRLLVADEPTGNLDSLMAQKIVTLFRTIVQQTGITLLIATHDTTVVAAADRVLQMRDGNLLSD
ncbi:ABC transporter ATP-binding protein [Tengunoibacter tsumagoiensis]|uniref:ABC transporter ATP-binding protein n=1 Tax=Tengunoibacter tsumagoiensis TaxID=2014871 RepID=A0A402A1H9_9CHLR|nr:ABC transporter ATP-binding protein [Tengunoibacter tsumagoiensis]GCE12912.1 ABC transporter ATP-binding protein [Tengunoibacter tsumagoiensis]